MTQIITIEETSHSRFSPSGSSRWLKCPGSITLVESLNLPNTSSYYAMEGTAAHELASKCLTEQKDAVAYLGAKIGEFEVTIEMAAGVQVYLDFVREKMTFESTLHVEEKVDLSFLYPDQGGTSDAIVENPTEVDVADLKYGKGLAVEAFENSQMMIYAIGHLQKIFKRLGTLKHVERVNVHIVQPRSPHKLGPIRTYTTSVDALRKFSKYVKERIANAVSENPEFVPGDSQCQWCPASPVCRHLADYNLKLAQLEFAHLKIGNAQAPDPNRLTVEEQVLIVKNSKMFEKWLKAMNAYATMQLRSGKIFPGYKMVRKRANRVWKDPKAAEAFLIEQEIEEEKLFKKKFLSPSQAETLVGRKKKDLLKDLITKPLGGLTMAHESDGRPAVSTVEDALMEFAEFLVEPGEFSKKTYDENGEEVENTEDEE